MSTAKKPSNRGARFGLGLGIAICFIWSQVCGWAVTGRMLADDGARRTGVSGPADDGAFSRSAPTRSGCSLMQGSFSQRAPGTLRPRRCIQPAGTASREHR